MAFSDETIQGAWSRAGGRCECRRRIHEHGYSRCNKQLVFASRGRSKRGAWEAHHTSRTGGDVLSNCEILCSDCHSLAV